MTRVRIGLVAAQLAAAALLLGACGGASRPIVPNVTAGLGQPPRALPAGLIGIDGEAVTAPGHVWSTPRFVAAVAGLAPQALRVFGGTTANFWNWRTGTFVDARALPSTLRPLRRLVSVRLADWARVVLAAHAIPVYDLNMFTSTLADQLAMLRAARGLGLQVTRVELGDELYLPPYAGRFPSGAAYGRVATRWIAALQGAFPGVQVAADAFAGADVNAGMPNARTLGWNAGLRSTLRGESALSLHTYFSSGLPSGARPRAVAAAATMLSAPARRWAQVRPLLAQLPPGVSAWVTEWNLFDPSALVHGTWAQGLAVASFGLDLLGDARVSQSDNHALVSSAPFGAIFADRSGLDVGPRSGFFLPAIRPPRTVPFALSASGTAMSELLYATRGASVALPMTFAGGQAAGPSGTLQGIALDAKDGVHAIVLNLGPVPIELRLPDQLSRLRYRERWAAPTTLVSGPSALQQRTGDTGDSVLLEPYSLTRIVRSERLRSGHGAPSSRQGPG